DTAAEAAQPTAHQGRDVRPFRRRGRRLKSKAHKLLRAELRTQNSFSPRMILLSVVPSNQSGNRRFCCTIIRQQLWVSTPLDVLSSNIASVSSRTNRSSGAGSLGPSFRTSRSFALLITFGRAEKSCRSIFTLRN